MESTLNMERNLCFQFKASFAPCTILQITRYDLGELEKHIALVISRAPNFFYGAPIVIDLARMQAAGTINFTKIKEILVANNLVPMGIREGTPEQIKSAAESSLPSLSIGRLTHAVEAEKKKKTERNPTKVITTPIRSGMQIYAKDTDLVVLSSVSAGAELLADGHIHVYGPLRGRALAGVQGDVSARIFCRELEAELVSIAGYYLTKEEVQPMQETRGMIQVYLDSEQVRIAAL